MARSRPLMNPKPREVVQQTSSAESTQQSQVQVARPPREQMRMEMTDNKTKFKQIFNSFKFSIKKRNKVIEVSRFWQSPAVPFMMVSSLTNILLMFIGGIFTFSDISVDQIPLFYDPIQQTWSENLKVDKSFIYIIPIFLTMYTLIQYRLILVIFKQDKRLALVTAWIIGFTNLLLTIAIIQIYKLIT